MTTEDGIKQKVMIQKMMPTINTMIRGENANWGSCWKMCVSGIEQVWPREACTKLSVSRSHRVSRGSSGDLRRLGRFRTYAKIGKAPLEVFGHLLELVHAKHSLQ